MRQAQGRGDVGRRLRRHLQAALSAACLLPALGGLDVAAAQACVVLIALADRCAELEEHARCWCPSRRCRPAACCSPQPHSKMQELNLTSADGRYAYTIHTADMLTWDEAAIACIEEGGQLAYVESQAEWDLLAGAMKASRSCPSCLYLRLRLLRLPCASPKLPA